MCLTETYSRVRVGKNVSDRFPIRKGLKQGDALSPLLFKFALEFKYLGTTLTIQNSIREEIKCRLRSGNACLSFGAESFVFQVAVQEIKD